MSGLRQGIKRLLFSLVVSSLWIWQGSALAQLTSCAAGTTCYYVAVQPIDVCSDSGTGCAPFNTVSRTGNPTTVSSTNPVGFVDATTGKDLTQAITNQLGVQIAWQPMKQYNNTCYQTIQIDSCMTTSCSSQQFAKLTGVGSSTYSCTTNSMPPPLNSVSTTLNMFFVNVLNPPSTNPGTLYGYSWIGNNGIAISSNTFFPPYPLTPRYDTMAHEFHHNMGLNHSDSYNYGFGSTLTAAPPSDLMTTGSSRTEPSSTSNTLSQLSKGEGTGTADQLDCNGTSTYCAESTSNSTTNVYQRNEVATTGFLNPITTATTTITKTK